MISYNIGNRRDGGAIRADNKERLFMRQLYFAEIGTRESVEVWLECTDCRRNTGDYMKRSRGRFIEE